MSANENALPATGALGAHSLQRLVRPRPQNLAATVFVFESTRKPYTTHVVYLDQASGYVDNPKWKHTATLDPAIWIEHLMNNPQQRQEQIESICFWPNDKLRHGGEKEGRS